MLHIIVTESQEPKAVKEFGIGQPLAFIKDNKEFVISHSNISLGMFGENMHEELELNNYFKKV